MHRPTSSSLLLVAALGSCVWSAGGALAGTENEPAGTKGAADTPYEGGPPPVTDGYTDTTQGGTKTSGDAPIPPPSRDGKVESLQGTPETVAPAAPTPSASR